MTRDRDGDEQLALLGAPARPSRAVPPVSRPASAHPARSSPALRPARTPRAAPPIAAELPVARVAVDVGLAHLDRPFDFLVPEPLSADAQPGVRVRVRFAGRLVSGFLIERVAGSEHRGHLATLDRVVSPEPVLSPELLALARQVADRYAGTVADVLRLALPPRHARVEQEPPRPTGWVAPPDPPDPGAWRRYPDGPGLLEAIRGGGAPRAVWTALPGPTWPDELALLVRAALAAGRGALVVLPDQRDVDRVDSALQALDLGAEAPGPRQGDAPGQHLVLTADLGPAERYRRWLRVRRGQVRAVVGTRAAMFAPVHDLGLVVVWDDGDDLHAEPRAPYPHVRTVLSLRSAATAAALVVAGLSRTAEGASLVRSGWATSITAPRPAVRRCAPAVHAEDGSGAGHPADAGAAGARLPGLALRTVREGLAQGPVLVQVPRAGYLPGLACAGCRAAARCPGCQGPLGRAGPRGSTACRWCGSAAAGWQCAVCGGERLRARVVGSDRTAEELARAFPRSAVVVSEAGEDRQVLARVSAEPAVVVATPGAEPVADGGYAAALLLDGWALLSRPDLRAAEEALRRWTAAAALVRAAPEGGRVVVLAGAGMPAVQALVRWDHAGFADRELDERAALRLPPAERMASLTGDRAALAALLADSPLPDEAEVLGPVPVGAGDERFLVRAPGRAWPATVTALATAQATRSAHKAAGSVRVQIDPREIA